jgi:hypothetical protein
MSDIIFSAAFASLKQADYQRPGLVPVKRP